MQMILGYMLHPDPGSRLSFKGLLAFINNEYFKDDELREKFEEFLEEKEYTKNGNDMKDNAVDEDFMNKMNDTIRKALLTNEQQPVKVYSLPKSKVTSDNEFIGRYQGYLNKEGNPDGAGKFYFLNGEKYEGMWKDGKFHGIGRYYWVNGMKYYGEFKDDQMDGYGICYYQDGGIY